ncbi:MAG TPA: hypothetical protein VND92_02460, partial [Vicinamibacterales bacterium]|nr:hypothetical protein [Vicinamibacterales bacterium]
MRLTDKLLGFLNRVFDKDGRPFLALRLSYAGAMTWQVADGVLTTTAPGAASLSVDLSGYTVASLAAFLAVQPGYAVPYLDGSALAQLSALVLIDGSGDIRQSNGDHLFGYTNPNWAVLDAFADQLEQAGTAIAAMPAEMSTTTADGEWLDLQGGYYSVDRQLGEADGQYGPRIIATVLQPRSNNLAIAAALSAATGQACQVPDVVAWGSPVPAHNGLINHDGSHTHNASAAPIYCLFDVATGYDLLGGASPTAFIVLVQGIVEALRAGGTHLRAVTLQGSTIADAAVPPTDAVGLLAIAANLQDVASPPSDALGVLSLGMPALSDA